MTVSGSCLCGSVRFDVDGDFEWFYLCHCRHCQKDTGWLSSLYCTYCSNNDREAR